MKHMYQVMLLIIGLMMAAGAAADEWEVVHPDSYIGFVATYDDIPFDARFEVFEADIRFDPDDLGNAAFDIRIDVGSVNSNSVDRDKGMQQEEWFAVDAHPIARFRTSGFEKLSAERYKVIGTLELKGVRRNVEIPFEWQKQPNGGVILRAATTLQRGDFNIGSGEWAEDDTIGFAVEVEATLKLTKPP